MAELICPDDFSMNNHCECTECRDCWKKSLKEYKDSVLDDFLQRINIYFDTVDIDEIEKVIEQMKGE